MCPNSTFFLLGASDEVVAVSNLRHWLNEFLQEVGGHIGFGVRPTARLRGFATEVLHCTVLEARRQGIENVLVTCKKGNVGSEQAISKNGGILESEIWSDMHSCIMRRFWISTTN
ncbi:GNAT family N-acetyltransferase [Salinisphaera orenii]|uniref:GNAT family N-acetyltransferase n=1 Tax=Salinisphaera orenii TaxID=856731 RepID=UPI003A4C611B